MATLQNPDAFYKGVRSVTGKLDQMQVDVIADMLASAAHWPIAWLAYGLATGWHEARLRPIEEIGHGHGRPYGVPDATGQIPFGRGLVQLTWAKNYAMMDARLGLKGALIKNYALAMKPGTAVDILVIGMEEGLFTGVGLKRYLPDVHGTTPQFIEARRIINGTDRAAMIAGYAQSFQAAITAGGWK